METESTNYPAPGTMVEFTGGVGRGEHGAAVQRGIVNGPPIINGAHVMIPVHVRDGNHNVLVHFANITATL